MLCYPRLKLYGEVFDLHVVDMKYKYEFDFFSVTILEYLVDIENS
jgi:hypothetical protein